MLPNGPCLTLLGSHLLWCMLWTPCDQTLLSVQYACTIQKVIGWFRDIQLSTPVNIKVWPLTNSSKKYVVLLLLIRKSFTKLDHIVACVLVQSSDTHSILVWEKLPKTEAFIRISIMYHTALWSKSSFRIL